MENGELTRWFHLCEWIGQFICIAYPVGAHSVRPHRCSMGVGE